MKRVDNPISVAGPITSFTISENKRSCGFEMLQVGGDTILMCHWGQATIA